MLVALVHFVVDTQNNGGVGAAGRGRDDHLFSAATVNVGSGFGGIGENPGTFHHDVNGHLRPGNVCRIRLLELANGFSIKNQVAVVGTDGSCIRTIGTVVFEQVGGGIGVPRAVDRHQVQPVLVSVGKGCACHQPPNAAKAVDTDARRHLGVPPVGLGTALPAILPSETGGAIITPKKRHEQFVRGWR